MAYQWSRRQAHRFEAAALGGGRGRRICEASGGRLSIGRVVPRPGAVGVAPTIFFTVFFGPPAVWVGRLRLGDAWRRCVSADSEIWRRSGAQHCSCEERREASRGRPPDTGVVVSLARAGGGEGPPAGAEESPQCLGLGSGRTLLVASFQRPCRFRVSAGGMHAAAPLSSSARRPGRRPNFGEKCSESFLLHFVVVKLPLRRYCGFTTTRGGGNTALASVLRFYHHPGPTVFFGPGPGSWAAREYVRPGPRPRLPRAGGRRRRRERPFPASLTNASRPTERVPASGPRASPPGVSGVRAARPELRAARRQAQGGRRRRRLHHPASPKLVAAGVDEPQEGPPMCVCVFRAPSGDIPRSR